MRKTTKVSHKNGGVALAQVALEAPLSSQLRRSPHVLLLLLLPSLHLTSRYAPASVCVCVCAGHMSWWAKSWCLLSAYIG